MNQKPMIRMISRLSYYSAWYQCLSSEELSSWLGQWIRERIDIYMEQIKAEVVAIYAKNWEIQRMALSVGCYKSIGA